MLEKLAGIINGFENNSQQSVLVITASGDKAFCAGADLNEIRSKNYAEGLNL